MLLVVLDGPSTSVNWVNEANKQKCENVKLIFRHELWILTTHPVFICKWIPVVVSLCDRFPAGGTGSKKQSGNLVQVASVQIPPDKTRLSTDELLLINSFKVWLWIDGDHMGILKVEIMSVGWICQHLSRLTCPKHRLLCAPNGSSNSQTCCISFVTSEWEPHHFTTMVMSKLMVLCSKLHSHTCMHSHLLLQWCWAAWCIFDVTWCKVTLF